MGVFARGNKLWISFKDQHGRWRNASTGHNVGEEALAQRKYDAVVAAVKAQLPAPKPSIGGSLRAYAETWLDKRREADLDWKNDRSRLEHHVLPYIGDMPLDAVRAKHVAELVHRWRTTKLETTGEVMAQRTVYNVYSVISALFRDAKIADLIEQTPCCLTEAQLGPLVDSDPEWRGEAVFTRDEACTLISDERIPLDRRVYYGLGLLAGLRPGEITALRVRHYEPDVKPLGRLTVAFAHNVHKGTIKGTKTNATRRIPVHPTLAAMLAEWLLSGFAAMMGRPADPDDLLLPLPPADAKARRSREGEPLRTGDYAARRWRDNDRALVGGRNRELYATKSTFITLAIEDGARPEIIRDRVTHTKPRRDAFDGYDRGPHWIETCAEVAKLQLFRHAMAMAAGGELPQCDLSAASASSRDDESFGAGDGIRTLRVTASPSTSRASTLRLVKEGPDEDPVDVALRAVSIALRADAGRTRRALLRLLAEFAIVLLVLAGVGAGCAAQPGPTADAAEPAGLEIGGAPIDPLPGKCSDLAYDAPKCCLLACESWDAFKAECAPPPGSCVDFLCPTRDGGHTAPGLCTPALH